MRILLIEDDEETATFIRRGLSEFGDTIQCCSTVLSGLSKAREGNFDVVVFDRLLPDMDGLTGVKLMREAHMLTPVLMLTALSGIDDRVNGLNAGADDYLVKPFAFSEMYARLQALARRPAIKQEQTLLTIDDLSLDRTTQIVTRSDTVLNLLPREYKILEYLMQNEGRVVTRTMLLERVWGYNFDPKTSLVQTHLSRLRMKVDKPFDTELISTIRGAGYVISA